MKMLLDITLPHQPFNAAVKDGTAGSKLNRILEATKPEAVYFTEQHGQRGAVLIEERQWTAARPIASSWSVGVALRSGTLGMCSIRGAHEPAPNRVAGRIALPGFHPLTRESRVDT